MIQIFEIERQISETNIHCSGITSFSNSQFEVSVSLCSIGHEEAILSGTHLKVDIRFSLQYIPVGIVVTSTNGPVPRILRGAIRACDKTVSVEELSACILESHSECTQ